MLNIKKLYFQNKKVKKTCKNDIQGFFLIIESDLSQEKSVASC